MAKVICVVVVRNSVFKFQHSIFHSHQPIERFIFIKSYAIFEGLNTRAFLTNPDFGIFKLDLKVLKTISVCLGKPSLTVVVIGESDDWFDDVLIAYFGIVFLLNIQLCRRLRHHRQPISSTPI